MITIMIRTIVSQASFDLHFNLTRHRLNCWPFVLCAFDANRNGQESVDQVFI